MHKIINTAVIFTILGCWEGQGLACSSDIFYLRVPMGIDKKRARAAEILARDGGTEGLPEDSQALKAKRKEQEKIERVGVAIRSFSLSHGDKFFDYASRWLRIQSGVDYMHLRVGENTPLNRKLNHMQEIVNDADRLLNVALNGRRDSKQDTLTVNSAEKYINELNQVENSLALLRQQIEEVRQGLNTEYQVAEELRTQFLIRCIRTLEAIPELAEMLQSRIEIATVTSLDSRVDIGKAIHEMSAWDKVITEVNNLPSLLLVRGNRLTLSSAIWNIVNNARYFAKKKQEDAARVNVRITEENGFVKIDIADNGPGIPADLLEIDPLMNRPKLFNLNVSQREGGTGLGTTEAWYAIKDSGGTIEVDSLTQDQIDNARHVYRMANVQVLSTEPVMAVLRSFAEEIDKHFSQMIEASDALIKAFEQGIEIDIQHFDMVGRNLSNKPFSAIFAGTKMEPEAQTRLAGRFHSANRPGVYFNGIWYGIKSALTKNLPLDKKDKIEKLKTFKQNTEFWREIFRRISKGQRVEPGTTFTIRLLIVQGSQPSSPPDALPAGGGIAQRQTMISL